jgi:Protein kinase domain
MLNASQILHDRYQLQTQLGKQPGRQTWLAQDLSTQTPVILKLLGFGHDLAWEHVKLFEREAQILKTLKHEAIPKYIDGFELDLPNYQGFALVQTYIAAPSLEAQFKAGRRFSEAEMIQLASQILTILAYLHSHTPPIIHRDLKPSNILLTDRSGNNVGQVYLVDFGAVQNVAAIDSGTFTVVGTYGYMPLEQYGGRACPASDLYSLGATLIYLMTGQHPADLLQADLHLDFNATIQVQPDFMAWLKQMVEPSLKRRFASAQGAKQALQKPSPAVGSQLCPATQYIRVNTPEKLYWVDHHPINYWDLAEALALVAFYGLAILGATIALSSLPSLGLIYGCFWLAMIVKFLIKLNHPIQRCLAAFTMAQLVVDGKQLQVVQGNGKFQRYQINCYANEINGLHFTPRHIKQITDHQGRKYQELVKPTLHIWVKGFRYELLADSTVNEVQLKWLARELSRRLAIDLQVTPVLTT